MTRDDAGLQQVLSAIVDGARIDWASAESSAADESLREVISELKVIAEIADVHRSVPLPAQPHTPAFLAESSPETLGTWGPLRLIEKVGQGAYGEVYRAWDTRLDREVALKLLPVRLADGDARDTSIIEEGRLLARVRHPNVVTIHGAERIENRIGLWMEFVKGRTLEQLLQEGKVFTPAGVTEIGVALCQAISAVHGAGLLHRDIKTHNVMLADDGRVVLMDFGTGRELNDGASKGLAGTPLYLAPELLSGGEATIRSDIYSVGVLLYHLLTGAYPVQGHNLRDLRVAHQRNERTNLRSARPHLPPRLARVIERAIDPQPEQRYESTDALRADLAALRPRSRVMRLAYATAVAAAVILAVTVAWEVRGRQLKSSKTPSVLLAGVVGFKPADATHAAAQMAPASGAATRIVPVTSLPGDEIEPALSPDGTQVAFAWNRGDGAWDIHVKLVDADQTLQLTRPPGGTAFPAWSPDGRFIAFIRRFLDDRGTSKNAVFVIPALGGSERTLWLGPDQTVLSSGLDWAPDGAHVVACARSSLGQPDRLLLISVVSRESRTLTSPPPTSLGDRYPVFAPDGESIAFVRNTASESGIYLLNLAGGDVRRLMAASSAIRRLAWSSDGESLIFTSYRGIGRNSLWRVSVAGGEPEPVAGTGEGAGDPSTSRRGARLVFTQDLMDQNLYRADLAGEQGEPIKQLIPSARAETDPDVSPDGSHIAFVSDRLGHSEIWVMQADGSHPTQLTNLRSVCRRPRWSPDGHQIAFSVGPIGMNRDIQVIDAAGGAPRRLTADASNDQLPTWSHDARWIYVMSDRSGAREIWKVPAAGGPAVQVTKGGGFKAWESRDGRFLFYSTDGPAPAIWRMPASGGTPTLILKLPEGTAWGGEWVLTDSGIYWLNRLASPRPAIEFLSFATGRVTRAVTPLGAYDAGSGFAVSPDGRWLVFTQREYSSSDIMMIEGIR